MTREMAHKVIVPKKNYVPKQKDIKNFGGLLVHCRLGWLNVGQLQKNL
jgi:hypothetical protein